MTTREEAREGLFFFRARRSRASAHPASSRRRLQFCHHPLRFLYLSLPRCDLYSKDTRSRPLREEPAKAFPGSDVRPVRGGFPWSPPSGSEGPRRTRGSFAGFPSGQAAETPRAGAPARSASAPFSFEHDPRPRPTGGDTAPTEGALRARALHRAGQGPLRGPARSAAWVELPVEVRGHPDRPPSTPGRSSRLATPFGNGAL